MSVASTASRVVAVGSQARAGSAAKES